MHDPRVRRLADLLVGYSLALERGELVAVQGGSDAAPLALELCSAALRAGAHPVVELALEEVRERLLAEGTEEQVTFVPDYEKAQIEEVAAAVTLWSETNTRSLSRADSTLHSRYLAARRSLSMRFYERVAKGEAKWCGTLFPTQAHAQDAQMSLRDYEAFVYGACHVAEGDGVSHWQEVSRSLHARAASLADAREIRVLGPDTDLVLEVRGRTWSPADGRMNMPDGEVYTSPVEEATRGDIRFSFPAVFNGRGVEDVRLRFEGGRVVRAEAARGEEYLRALLDMDGGSRTAGEFAFGLNYEIDRFTNNILFDEKIGGTVHVALGAGFKELGGRNESGLHWDLICDLREDGEVYVDGELVWKAGSFVHEPEEDAAEATSPGDAAGSAPPS